MKSVSLVQNDIKLILFQMKFGPTFIDFYLNQWIFFMILRFIFSSLGYKTKKKSVVLVQD